MHEVPQRFWKENDFSSNEAHILQHLKLENGEKAIVRYTLKTSSSNSWKLLKFNQWKLKSQEMGWICCPS